MDKWSVVQFQYLLILKQKKFQWNRWRWDKINWINTWLKWDLIKYNQREKDYQTCKRGHPGKSQLWGLVDISETSALFSPCFFSGKEGVVTIKLVGISRPFVVDSGGICRFSQPFLTDMILLGCLSGAFIIWIPTVFAAAGNRNPTGFGFTKFICESLSGDDVVASRKCAPGALYFQAQPVGVSVDIVSLYESASDSANLCATFCYSVATCKSAIFTVGFDEYPGRCRLTTTELGCDTELPQLNSFPENLTSIRYLALQCFECKGQLLKSFDFNQFGNFIKLAILENLIKNGSYPVTSYPSETAMNQSG